jgi:single-strand DNA-binding protein
MNKVFLIGNLTRDPELTETSNNTKICRFSIAVSRNYSNADGERQTDFFNCIAWRGLAETVSRYTHKGDKVALSGSIELRNYEDGDGVKRTVVDIVVQDIEFLTQKQRDNTDKPSNTGSRSARQQLIPFDDDSDIPF